MSLVGFGHSNGTQPLSRTARVLLSLGVEFMMNTAAACFRLAPMSALILGLTVVLWALPIVFIALAVVSARGFFAPALVVLALYAWIWLRFRPSRFVVHPHSVEVIWPMKCAVIHRQDISSVRMISGEELRREAGWGLRVGAGGLWGGFGWLWTTRRGIVQMYVSHGDGLVWIERAGGLRPWLITPERPDAFVHILASRGDTLKTDAPVVPAAEKNR